MSRQRNIDDDDIEYDGPSSLKRVKTSSQVDLGEEEEEEEEEGRQNLLVGDDG